MGGMIFLSENPHVLHGTSGSRLKETVPVMPGTMAECPLVPESMEMILD